jgi:hypothetical protein
MPRFIFVLLFASIFVITITLAWPRFFDQPRPSVLENLNSTLRKTSFGHQAVNVLGVSDEQSVVRISPQLLKDTGVNAIKGYATDVIITHATRLIVEHFSTLPGDKQQQILEALSESLSQENASPSENLPQASQSGTNTNNNSGDN